MREQLPKEPSKDKKEEIKTAGKNEPKKIYQDRETGQVITEREWEEKKKRDDWREQP